MRQSRILCASALTGLALVALSAAGCAGYRVGTDSLYSTEIHTVYVPMFQSVSFRRNLGEMLTEAVIKEIQLKTPYTVVAHPPADTILTGRIVGDNRRTVVPSPVGGPREAEVMFYVEVSWIDNRGKVLCPSNPIPVPAAILAINDSASVVPEYGQSIATGQQEAIHRVAQQIVGTMEAPW